MEPNDLERFEATLLPHLDAAYTLARHLTRNDQDAQDVVQDASDLGTAELDDFVQLVRRSDTAPPAP